MMVHDQSARFFGDPAHSLFGVFHVGRGDTVRDTAVLLCHAAPQEYSMTHWSMRQLATRLADVGFPVLRFDYFATGDSAGVSADASLARWVDNIDTAAEELRDASGVRRLSIVGLRLGAALAVRAVARGLRVRDLVLWDPVVSGTDYVAMMDKVDQRVLRSRHYPVSNRTPVGELFGYPFGDAIRRDTSSVNLLAEPLGAPRRLLIVSPGTQAAQVAQTALSVRAKADDLRVVQECVDDPLLYGETMDPLDTLLAHGAMRTIVSFLGV